MSDIKPWLPHEQVYYVCTPPTHSHTILTYTNTYAGKERGRNLAEGSYTNQQKIVATNSPMSITFNPLFIET